MSAASKLSQKGAAVMKCSACILKIGMPVVMLKLGAFSTCTGWEITFCQLVAVEQLGIR